MVAVPLLHGRLTAADYEDSAAADPASTRCAKTVCVEDPQFTQDYHDPDKRSIANALTIEFADGSKLAEVAVEYPLGHRRRRAEGIPPWSRSSGPTLPAASRPSSNKRFSTCRWMRQSSKRCRSMSTSTCM